MKNFIKQSLNLKGYSITNIDMEFVYNKRTKANQNVVIIDVAPRKNIVYRCPHCQSRGSKYDTQYESRMWRTMDAYGHLWYIRCKVPRIRCKEHGVVTAQVPWASHHSRFTHKFEQYVATLA